MLAATAHGLSTAPMEGFDERRVCFELGIPIEEYTIPLAISIGYSPDTDDTTADGDYVIRPKIRYPVEDVCYSNRFGDNLNLGDESL